MTYYVMLPGDTEKEVYFDSNLLGENTGFGVFWAGAGLKILMSMVDKQPEVLPDVKIKPSEYTEFGLKTWEYYCNKHNIDFDVINKWTTSYNLGYYGLDMQHVVRPNLYPPENGIGGHCVIPKKQNKYIFIYDGKKGKIRKLYM